jgi:hypothetical protein
MSVSVSLDRRRSNRTRVSTRVGTITGRAIAVGKAHDISLHGMFVQFQMSDPNKALRIGDLLSVRFSLPNFDGPIEAKCVVARIELRPTGEVRGIGLDFIELEEPGLSAVEAYVE